MLHGALVYIDKDKNGDRDIEGAIRRGLRLYERHYGKTPALELIALVNPKMFTEQKLQEGGYSLDVEWHENVPYSNLWVCKIGDVDYGDYVFDRNKV